MLKSKKDLEKIFTIFTKNTSEIMGMNMGSMLVKMYLFYHDTCDETVEGTLYAWGCRKAEMSNIFKKKFNSLEKT